MRPVVMDWESRLGRRLRIRDLHILAAAVKCGSMAKAAQQLGWRAQSTMPDVVGKLVEAELERRAAHAS